MKNIGEKKPRGVYVCVSATPRFESATAICIWHVKYAKVMVHMFDIVRQLTALRSQMENHKTIEEQMNIAMLHTARHIYMYYGYSHISIATPHLPFRYALYIFLRVSINCSQQRPCSRKTLATPRANVKHMSKAQTRTNNMKN